MVKCYEFSLKGLNKAIADSKMEKINRWMDIGFWALMGILTAYGLMQYDTLIKMCVCSGTSKIVKFLIK
jgi:hypothetical protein